MPRAKSDITKSSAELDAEIQEMQKKIADKRKAAQAAKRREKAEAEFNKEFVEAAKGIYLYDYVADGRTIYEMIHAIIRSAEVPATSTLLQDLGGYSRGRGSVSGPGAGAGCDTGEDIHRVSGTETTGFPPRCFLQIGAIETGGEGV